MKRFLAKLEIWNAKYDIGSFSTDFLFIIGVLLFDWNPVLLILWLLIDLVVMFPFVYLLFHKENKDWIMTAGFFIVGILVVGTLVALHLAVESIIEDLELEDVINTDPSQIINPIILPLLLSTSGLTHFAEYNAEVRVINTKAYKSDFIKYFFLRILLMLGVVCIIGFMAIYFDVIIIVALLALKAVLRVYNKKVRKVF